MTNEPQPPIGLLKHLRGIHFLVVLASLLTLLAIVSGPKGDVSAAREQLERIATIQSSWDKWTQRFGLEQLNWLKSRGIKWLDPDAEPMLIEANQYKKIAPDSATESAYYQLKLEGLPIYFFLEMLFPRSWPPQKLILAMPEGRISRSDTLPLDITFGGSGGGSQSFATIEEFQKFWESAREQPRVWYVEEPPPAAYFFIGSNVTASLPIKTNLGQGSPMPFENSSLEGCRGDGFRAAVQNIRDNSYDTFFCRSVDKGVLIIPMRSRQAGIHVDLQQWLIQEFDLPGPAGAFSDSFPELDRVTENYQEVPLEKAVAILSAELARGVERVEFLGMSLPQTLMATWGGFVLFILQLYFWLHLRALHRVGVTSAALTNEVAWIGIYPDKAAQVIAFSTIFVVPVVVTLWAVIRADLSTIVGAIFPLLVALPSWSSARLVWRLSAAGSKLRGALGASAEDPDLLSLDRKAEQGHPADTQGGTRR